VVEFRMCYVVLPGGAVLVDCTLRPLAGTAPTLPRFGVQLALADGFRRVGWLGRGPHESYWDRKEGARLGWFDGSILNQTVPYVRPQENGNKEEVSLAYLTSAAASAASAASAAAPSAAASPRCEGCGVLVVGSRPFGFEAHHFADEDFGSQNTFVRSTHTSDLQPSPYTWLHVDYRQQGVGGIDSWGWHPAPLARYTVRFARMRLRFALASVAPSEHGARAVAVARAKALQGFLEDSSPVLEP